MGYNINVDHSKFETAASAIETYISEQDKYMENMSDQIQYLTSNWKGEDAVQFKLQWDTVTDATSTSEKLKNSLKNYAETLRYASTQYKNAQANAINRANSLPRW